MKFLGWKKNPIDHRHGAFSLNYLYLFKMVVRFNFHFCQDLWHVISMGNSLAASSKFNRQNHNCSKLEFYNKVKSSQGGDELLSCSFGSWCREQRLICGFSDRADYTSNRQSFLQFNGSPNKPDTTEGRFFQTGFRYVLGIIIIIMMLRKNYIPHSVQIVRKVNEYECLH